MFDFPGRTGIEKLIQLIKGRLANVATSGNYNDLENKPAALPANGGNSDTVDGLQGYELGTLNKNDVFHGNDWKLRCKYDTFNDGRFGFYFLRNDGKIGDQEVRVDYATNADTVDNLHANDFMKVNEASGYDCNTLYDAGLYLCTGEATNTPNDLKFGTVLVMPYRKPYGNPGPDFCAHIYIPNGDADDKSLWYRTSLRDSWNEWARSCDGGNADTLDGFHASDLYSPNNKPYVTGSTTTDTQKVKTDHGFMPSAVFYWIPSQGRWFCGSDTFDTTSFQLSFSPTESIVVNFLIFR